MLEQLKYKNHINEVFEFGKDGIFVNTNDLHDYEWDVTSKGNKISSFNRKIKTRKLPIVIMCDTEAEGIAARNKLFEVTEKDVLAKEPGQIIIGDYYYKCYVTKSQKKEYQISKRHMVANLTLTSDHPYWVKEATQSFGTAAVAASGGGDTLTWDGNIEGLDCFGNLYYRVSDAAPTIEEARAGGSFGITDGTASNTLAFDESHVLVQDDVAYFIHMGDFSYILVVLQEIVEGGDTVKKGVYFMNYGNGTHITSLTISGYTGFDGGGSDSGSGLDYPFDYAFDYLGGSVNADLNNTDFVESNFKLIIFGACSNPTINIAGHTYQVNCDIAENEYLTIDSVAKTITLTANDGTVTNKFSSRNRDSYIFQKIVAGKSAVTWEGDLRFDVILLEERSEPKWI